ncbi:MAG: transcriptional repressor [Bacteroidetes bacterium]|nr:transcriptional repressor [Bacteroidota bacterium]
MVSTAEKRAKEQFTEFLREGNYRITSERFEVLAQVLKTEGHFDADTLYLQLRADGSKVSRATVYKTLTLLHQCGLVSRYMFSPGDFAQYEKTIDRPCHDHMVCMKCGRILEFPNGSVRYLQKQICDLHDFEGVYHTLQIFGVCSDCRRGKRNGAPVAGTPLAAGAPALPYQSPMPDTASGPHVPPLHEMAHVGTALGEEVPES